MRVGVNNNGVEWYELSTGNYLVFYYVGDGVKQSKLFENVSQSFIDKLSIEDLI